MCANKQKTIETNFNQLHPDAFIWWEWGKLENWERMRWLAKLIDTLKPNTSPDYDIKNTFGEHKSTFRFSSTSSSSWLVCCDEKKERKTKKVFISHIIAVDLCSQPNQPIAATEDFQWRPILVVGEVLKRSDTIALDFFFTFLPHYTVIQLLFCFVWAKTKT